MTKLEVNSQEGDAQSQLYLRLMRAAEGRHENAVTLWRKAFLSGVLDAGVFLGECYERGDGVEESMGFAVKLYCKAAEDGSELAKLKLLELRSKRVECDGSLYATGRGGGPLIDE